MGPNDRAISDTTASIIKIMTRFAVYNLDRNNNFDYSKAERELGYHTRSYEETLTDQANWLVEAGYVNGDVKVKTKPAAAAATAAASAATAALKAAGGTAMIRQRQAA